MVLICSFDCGLACEAKRRLILMLEQMVLNCGGSFRTAKRNIPKLRTNLSSITLAEMLDM